MSNPTPCRTCGALIEFNDKGKHRRWHEAIDREIEEAKQTEGY